MYIVRICAMTQSCELDCFFSFFLSQICGKRNSKKKTLALRLIVRNLLELIDDNAKGNFFKPCLHTFLKSSARSTCPGVLLP